MADGEIAVEVKSEGVEDAAGEIGSQVETPDGGGGPGTSGGDGGLRTALRGGLIGGLIAGALGPLLDLVDPILQILQAFVAPLAVVLLRLIQPVLALLLRALPYVFDIADYINDLIDRAEEFVPVLLDVGARIVSELTEMLDTIRNLPQNISDAITGAVFGSDDGPVSPDGPIDPETGEINPEGVVEDPTNRRPGEGPAADTIVSISSSARKLFDVVVGDGNIDAGR